MYSINKKQRNLGSFNVLDLLLRTLVSAVGKPDHGRGNRILALVHIYG